MESGLRDFSNGRSVLSMNERFLSSNYIVLELDFGSEEGD